MKINTPKKITIRILGDVRKNPFWFEPDEPAYLISGFKVKTAAGYEITHLMPAAQVEQF